MDKKRKKARVGQDVQPAKQARIVNAPAGEQQLVTWRFGSADLGGPFSWISITNDELNYLINVFREVDKKRTKEAMGDGMGEIKSIPTGNLSTDAQKRLLKIKRDDESWLHEIRLGNKPRVWGILSDNVFQVLWWDPDHQVCPSPLRNT